MAGLYLVDGKVCELTDVRFNFLGMKASGVTLTFYECARSREVASPTIETFAKHWSFPNPINVATLGMVPDSTKLQALGKLGIKAYVR